MATPAQTPTLAQAIKSKYPGVYDDMDDMSLESKVLQKYPQYGDMPRTQMPKSTAKIGAAPTGAKAYLNDLEGDVRYGQQRTIFGRILHAMGAKGINSGVTQEQADSVVGPVIGPVKALKGLANTPEHPFIGSLQALGGTLDTIAPFSGLGGMEAEGASQVIDRAVSKAGSAVSKVGQVAEDVNNVAAKTLRYPASARQSQLGRPGTAKNLLPSFLQKYVVPEWAIPKGSVGTATNPGPFAEIPVKSVVPKSAPETAAGGINKSVLQNAYTGERTGLPYQPNPRYSPVRPTAAPIPKRSGLALPPGPPEAIELNKSLLNGAWTGERTGLPYQPNPRYTPPVSPAAPIPPRQGLMLPPAPAAVEAAGIAKPAVSMFPRPMRPTIGTSEEWQAYEQQMKILKSEASDAGTYSAARGKVGKKLNYQQRIKKNF